MQVTILDFGVGNVRTLAAALAAGGAGVKVETDPVVATDADALVLPDAGGLGAAAASVAGAAPALRSALLGGLPCLAIGAGMHLLLEADSSGTPGLGLVPGKVAALAAHRVPHVGWNLVDPVDDAARVLLEGVDARAFYFAHNAVASPAEAGDVAARTEHEGNRFPSIVRRGGTWGVQFRPEKSGAAGLRLIHNFLRGVGA